MSLLDKLFGFKGRLGLLDWWALALLIGLVSQVVTPIVLGVLPDGAKVGESELAAQQYMAMAVNVVLLWPTIAIGVKRRHDQNSAGWPTAIALVLWAAIASLPILILFIWIWLMDKMGFWEGLFAAVALYGGLGVVLLVLLGFVPGTRGPNRFGPPPGNIFGGRPIGADLSSGEP